MLLLGFTAAMKRGVSLVLGVMLGFFFFLGAVVAVVADNYPNFEFVQRQDESSTMTAAGSKSTTGTSSPGEEAVAAAEWKSATEFAKVKPNNYPLFAFTKSEPAAAESSKQDSAAVTAAAAVEEKPDNYPNFEFRTEDAASIEEVNEGASSADVRTTSFQTVPEYKPNNYPNFEFKESTTTTAPVQMSSSASHDSSSFDQFTRDSFGGSSFGGSSFVTEEMEDPRQAASSRSSTGAAFTQYESSFGQGEAAVPRTGSTTAYRGSDASGRYASSFDLTNARHQAEVRGASTQASQFSNRYSSSTASEAKTNNPASVSSSSTYKGSDPYARYPSSFDLTNARYYQSQSQSETQQMKDSATHTPRSTTSTTYRGSDASARYPSSFDLTNARHQSAYGYNAEEEAEAGGSSSNTQDTAQFFSSDKTFDDESSAYRFNGADNKYYNTDQTTFSSSSFFPSFSHDTKETYSSSTGRTSGCSSSYWSSHLSKWPRFFTINSMVSDAFPGAKVRMIYGTTTLLQALYDTRADGYSKLLNHGVAALLNAYQMSSGSYQYSHTTVIELFTNALTSRTSAAQQALEFQNANTGYSSEAGCNV